MDDLGKRLGQTIDDSPTPHHIIHNAQIYLRDNAACRPIPSTNAINVNVSSYLVDEDHKSIIAYKGWNKYHAPKGIAITVSSTNAPGIKMEKKHENPLLEDTVWKTTGTSIWTSWYDRELTIRGAYKNNYNEWVLWNLPEKSSIMINNLAPSFGGSLIQTQLEQPLLANLQEIWGEEFIQNEIINKGIPLKSQYEFYIVDKQQATVSMINNEQCLCGPRINNQCGLWTSLWAFCGDTTDPFLTRKYPVSQHSPYIHVWVALNTEGNAYNHSVRFLNSVIETLFEKLVNRFNSTSKTMLRENSFIINTNNSHALHKFWKDPAGCIVHKDKNFPVDKFTPYINGGLIIKCPSNNEYDEYGTTEQSIKKLQVWLNKWKDPTSHWMAYKMYNKEKPSLGAMIRYVTKIDTVDLGISQLSMNSIRETVGTNDVECLYRFFIQFWSSNPHAILKPT